MSSMMAIELVYPFFFFFLLGFISFQKAIVSVFLLSSFFSLIEFVVFLCRLSSTDNIDLETKAKETEREPCVIRYHTNGRW